jgi:ubiquinone/menaquinone biosynthesis C-methylase UbiE
MVLPTTDYDAAYFGDVDESGGIKKMYGYTGGQNGVSGHEFQSQQNRVLEGETENFNPTLKGLMDKITGHDLTNVKVLDVGGCTGDHAVYAKRMGVGTYDVLDLNIDTWCSRHVNPLVDNFFTGDAITELAKKSTFKNNSYEVVFSSRFLDCLDDADIPTVVTEMTRIASTVQIHIVTESVNPENEQYYNTKTLAEWAPFFPTGTILISWNTQDVLVV